MGIKAGDEIITVPPLWYHGEDIGDRLGKVLSTEGHVLIEVYEYHDNPVKCFRSEIKRAGLRTKDDDLMEQINIIFDNIA